MKPLHPSNLVLAVALLAAQALSAAEPPVDQLPASAAESNSGKVKLARGVVSRSEEGAKSSPDSAGVPADVVKNTRTARYNDLSGLRALFEKEGAQIAAVIVEPVVGMSNVS